MKDTAPIGLGIIVVAALFGVIAMMVSYLVFDWEVILSVFVGAIVALIAAIVLWLGWRQPAAGPTGPRDLSADAHPRNAGTAGSSSASASAAPAASTAAPAAQAAQAPQAAPQPAAEAAPKPAAKAAPKAAPKAEPAPASASGDGPEMLSGPRAGGADDLKLLKGVGPKLEGVLNGLGVYHFDQVASWGPSDIAWVDDRLSFKGRIERDGWVDQAKTLAAGGETEFSKRSKK